MKVKYNIRYYLSASLFLLFFLWGIIWMFNDSQRHYKVSALIRE